MIELFINLLLINVIICLIFMSGFVDEVDDWISKRVRFHHLPKPFSCALCMTFWTSLIYVIIAGQFSILSICLCLANAHLTEITTPLIQTVKNWVLKIIEIMNKPVI